MSKRIKIIFTGGGSAGHVTPNLPLISAFKRKGASVFYLGSEQGIERTLIKPLNIPYYPITAGKLRRYWTWKNLLTPFQLLLGIWQSFLLCRRLKPDIIFSKGGFVALPIVIAARLNGIPVVIHESDLSPGLANRLSFPFAKLICITFAATAQFFINVANNDFLNHTAPTAQGWGYAVFAEVTEGKDIVDKMKAVPTANSGFHQNVPTTDLLITKAVVLE